MTKRGRFGQEQLWLLSISGQIFAYQNSETMKEITQDTGHYVGS
jgi:hypothetical protein